MKIAHVTNAIEWSGGLAQMTLLIEELKKKGVQNYLVCPPGSQAAEKLSPLGIPVRTISMHQDYDVFAAFKLRHWVQKESCDIVHTHHAIAHAVGLVGLLGLKKPKLVVSRRVSFPPRKNPFSRWKYTSSRIDAYTVVSRSIGDTLVRGGVPASKIHVVYSALDPRKFSSLSKNSSALKKDLGVPEGHFAVGKLANYSVWKGQHVFLQAAKLCLAKEPKIKFILIGKGTEALQAEVQSLGLARAVRILGFRADVADLLSALDVSVNSAIEGEGLSGAMRESLALGVPAVASDVSGNREIVRDGETGYLVPAKDPQALADKILHVLSHSQEARALAQEGRRWVIENASAEKMVSDTLNLYRSLCADSRD